MGSGQFVNVSSMVSNMICDRDQSSLHTAKMDFGGEFLYVLGLVSYDEYMIRWEIKLQERSSM